MNGCTGCHDIKRNNGENGFSTKQTGKQRNKQKF